MEDNPDLEVVGRIFDNTHQYVHENSTSVELSLEGSMGQPGQMEYPNAPPDKAHALIQALQEDLQDKVRDWNHKLTRELYAALEDQQSDEALIEWYNTNERRFDDEGEEVDLTDFMPVSNLPPGIRQRVLAQYADLFERTPEQVYTALMKRDIRFDRRGSRVDIDQFKRIDELDPKMRAGILEKNRNILVEDNFWAEPVEEEWKAKLEEMGFERIEIRYSLGYSQGDGASFTAGNIDVRKLVLVLLKQAKIEAAAKQLVSNLLE